MRFSSLFYFVFVEIIIDEIMKEREKKIVLNILFIVYKPLFLFLKKLIMDLV